MKPMISVEKKEEIIRRRNNGETAVSLAKEFNVSTRSISNYMKSDTALNMLNTYGFNEQDVTGGWIKGEEFSLRVNKNSKVDDISTIIKAVNVAKIEPRIIESVEKLDPSDNLLVISMADLHIGKRDFEGTSNNFSRLRDKTINAVKHSISQSNASTVLLITGNDVIHTDGKSSETTRGTPQDTSMSWDQMMEEAIHLYSEVIELLLSSGLIVKCHHTMSNHDYHLGYCTSLALSYKYPQCEWKVDTKPIKYELWGKQLIASTHGDGMKSSKLEGIIPLHARELGLNYKHCICFTGHFHHRVQKDMVGVTLRGLRSTAPTDQWHLESGYEGAPKSFEIFVIHKELGETTQLTFNI